MASIAQHRPLIIRADPPADDLIYRAYLRDGKRGAARRVATFYQSAGFPCSVSHVRNVVKRVEARRAAPAVVPSSAFVDAVIMSRTPHTPTAHRADTPARILGPGEWIPDQDYIMVRQIVAVGALTLIVQAAILLMLGCPWMASVLAVASVGLILAT